jgi:amidase
MVLCRVTSNPFNTTLTAGGSSGGEGALVGFRGSCLGIGTDIGGSIRSPAANNGISNIFSSKRHLTVQVSTDSSPPPSASL